MILSVLCCLGALARSGDPTRFVLQPDLEKKLWSVEARLPIAEAGPVDYWLERWTPGAYHLVEFGKYVESFTAADDGGELNVERLSDCQFRISVAHPGTLVIRYRARSISASGMDLTVLDVESNRITRSYAYLNPGSVLGFVPFKVDDPIELSCTLPTNWSAATALPREGDSFRARSFFHLEDSPILMAPGIVSESFDVDGIPHTVSVLGKPADLVHDITLNCRKVVEAGRDFMMGLPYERYHFLLGFVPEGGASGLEHSESTLILLSRVQVARADSGLVWNLIAHEYFHTWCAERIKVEELVRPDFTQPFRTGTIWLNESVTEYFCRHLLLRAGLLSREDFFARLSEEARVTLKLAESSDRSSLASVSRAAADIDSMEEFVAFAQKFYLEGPVTMFALDLAMRRASFGERGLADLLRFFVQTCVVPGRGVREHELMDVVSGVAQADLRWFARDHIEGTAAPDLRPLLGVLGYQWAGDEIVPLAAPSAEQLAAREDFFAPPRSASHR